MESFKLNHTAGVTCPGQGRSGRFEVPYYIPRRRDMLSGPSVVFTI